MTKMDLKDKVAVVTGGANGIGLSITKGLLENGASVALLDRDKEKGEESKKLLQEKYGMKKVDFFRCDVTVKEEFRGAVKDAVGVFSRLDIFVNDAGIGAHPRWEYVIEVNLIGVMRGVQEATNYMSKESGGKGGVIVNIASLAGLVPFGISPPYAAAKHGVIGLTRALGTQELYETSGIRHIAICPGWTKTDLTKKAVEEYTKVKEHLMNAKVIWQKPESVAKCVVEAVKKADTGSVWVVEDDEPAFEVPIQNYADFKPKSE